MLACVLSERCIYGDIV